MELTGLQVINIFNALENLSEKEFDLDTACSIVKNSKELSIAKKVIDDRRDRLLAEYAEKDEDGNIKQEENGMIHITNINEFQEECNKFLFAKTDVDIIKIRKGSLAGVKISPKDYHILEEILSED